MARDLRSESISALEAEGLLVTEWTDAPNASYPTHDHPQREVRIVLEGSMTLTVAGTRRVLRPGDRLDIPANTAHSAVVGGDGVRYLGGSHR